MQRKATLPWIRLAWIGLAILSAFARPAAAETIVPWRIAVTDIQALDVPNDEVSSATQVMAGEISKHQGFFVLPLETVRNAFGPLERPLDCVSDPECFERLASKLKADFIVFSSVATSDKKFEVTITVIDPKHPANPRRASEEMRQLGSVDMNVPLVLDKVFDWIPPIALHPQPPTPVQSSAPIVVPIKPDAPVVVPARPEGPVVVPLKPDAPTVVPMKPDEPIVVPLKQADP